MVLSQAVIFITNTLRLFIPDEIYLEGCVKIRTAAIDGERRQRSPEMKVNKISNLLGATISLGFSSLCLSGIMAMAACNGLGRWSIDFNVVGKNGS